MDKVVLDTIGNIFILMSGLVCVIFYKWCARETAKFYSKVFHRDYDEKTYQFFFLLGGAILAIWSLLSLFGINKSR